MSANEPSTVKGWDHLVTLLIEHGADRDQIERIFQDPRMPWFGNISFSPRPVESRAIYRHFMNRDKIAAARAYLRQHNVHFSNAEKEYGVSRYLIAAILLVETQLGRYTGSHPALYRLARVSAVGEQKNLEWNYERLIAKGEETTIEELRNRSRYLEELFVPEIIALMEIAKRNRIDIFNVKGSIAGAFGIPQFLPSSFLRFGVDANKDGKVSLFSIPDAIHSVANFLHHFGWRNDLSHEERRQVVWHYNRSDAYVDTVLEVAAELAGKSGL